MRTATLLGVVASLAAGAGVATADDLAAIEQAVPPCDPDRTYCFSIDLHVSVGADGFAAPADWIAAQVATANQHFKELGVGFQLARVGTSSAESMHVATRADRNQLAAGGLRGGVIHVFIVGQLDDIDNEGAVINGVTWRLPRASRKYVIVSARAWGRTLAHELGHVFGLPHSTYPISIMNKTERKEPPHDQRTFADEEFAAMRPVVRRLIRNKVVTPVKRPPTSAAGIK